VVQPKLTSLGLLQVVRTEESQSSSILLVILLLAVGAGTGISIDSHSHAWQILARLELLPSPCAPHEFAAL